MRREARPWCSERLRQRLLVLEPRRHHPDRTVDAVLHDRDWLSRLVARRAIFPKERRGGSDGRRRFGSSRELSSIELRSRENPIANDRVIMTIASRMARFPATLRDSCPSGIGQKPGSLHYPAVHRQGQL